MNLQKRALKHLMDLAIVLPTIFVALPLLVAVAIAVRWRLGSPVLFRQQRPGLGGHPFWMIKFRTMTNACGADGNALSDAERMTTLGRFLRQTSLDELPELWNVLRGEMSLVGPRPLLMQYLERYTAEQTRRHAVPPGITGWAQVNGRNAIPWERKFELDVWYVDNWSLMLDLKILCLTAMRVLRRDGIRSEGHATMPEFASDNAAQVYASDAVAVIGAGGHAKVVIETLRANGYTALTVYDDDSTLWGKSISGVQIEGPIRRIRDEPGRKAVIAIGSCQRRGELACELSCQWISVIHPAAVVSESAVIGNGTVIMAGAIVQPDAVIGQHVIVNTAASVDHDCRIGDFVHLAPGTCLAGGVHIGASSFCGIGSTVLPGVQLGDGVTLGAGAVAVQDLPSGAVAVGVPARVRSEERKAA